MSEYKEMFLDYMKPLEEEMLFSWIVRMLKFNSLTGTINYHSYEDMQRLFGKRISVPGFYFQNGLDYFLSNNNMTGKIFSSFEMVLKNMTVFPFYFAFMSPNEIQDIYNYCSKSLTYVLLEEKIRLRQGKQLLEGNCYIKICPKCFAETGGEYLRREHQIPGNYMCVKHKIPLQYCEYVPDWYKLDFKHRVHEMQTYKLNAMQEESAMGISIMINRILKEGLLVDILELKKRIRYRMRDLGYLDSKFNFYDYHEFLNDFGNELYFLNISREKVLFSAIYDTQYPVNPIFYLLLIQFLFHDLDAMYLFEVDSRKERVMKQYDTVTWNIAAKHSIQYYIKQMDSNDLKEHVIIGDTKNAIVVYHKKCGKYYCVSKTKAKISRCPYCSELREEKSLNACNLEVGNKNEYIHFVSTIEYGKLHQKKEKQVRNYCVTGRICGAIRIGNKEWLIPETAKYPRDNRCGNRKSLTVVYKIGTKYRDMYSSKECLESCLRYIKEHNERILFTTEKVPSLGKRGKIKKLLLTTRDGNFAISAKVDSCGNISDQPIPDGYSLPSFSPGRDKFWFALSDLKHLEIKKGDFVCLTGKELLDSLSSNAYMMYISNNTNG